MALEIQKNGLIDGQTDRCIDMQMTEKLMLDIER